MPTDVKVTIRKKNLLVASMARGLAEAIGGHKAVAGATDFRLKAHGSLIFRFSSEYRAEEFRAALGKYLGMHGAVAD